ncbi:MAG: twin-arginine translocation signal domain-containing protein [bacterium]|nr:twin-arginine translocation signal domain-containing protein [bacterium]
MPQNDPTSPRDRSLDRRDFVKLLAGGAAAAGLSLPLASCGLGGSSTDKKVIVLGLDGLDPKIVKALIDLGRAPHFKKLAEMGSFRPLATTMPALSPVAWSSFITGLTPGGHGIADFVIRDPETYLPVFSIYENRDPQLTFHVGDVHLPVKGGGPVNLRRGTPFWSYLTERGIPAWISKVPTNFPVDETATKAISGMGTPDLTDAYGMFNYYTSDPFEHYPNLSGGTVQYVDVVDHTVRAELLGPVNSLVTPLDTGRDPYANTTKLPFTVHLDPERDAVRIDIGDQSLLLQKGEFSDWVKVEFEMLPVIGTASGIARFLLKEVHPHFRLYVTPINIDPADQAMPVTYPAEWGAEIVRGIGSFWTKGLPADTKAFDYRVFSDEDYVKQAELILEERMALFDYQWSRFQSGLFFFYVSSTDQDAHMLWRNMDETHPMHKESDVRYAGYIYHLYEQMDELVGKVLPAVDDDSLLLICSDHGFAQFARQFHLNTWLRDQGYLTLKDGAEKKEETSIYDVDWKRTVAYGIGFNGLYLNLKGREAQGIVEPGKAAELTARLRRDLEALYDSETGMRPVTRAYLREEMYSGEMTPSMPELLVGYTPGYRNSAQSFLGATGKEVVNLNPWAWSGDHSMARDLVPGTLFSSRPVVKADPSILDLPVSILEFFGIEKPSQMVGSSIFKA